MLCRRPKSSAYKSGMSDEISCYAATAITHIEISCASRHQSQGHDDCSVRKAVRSLLMVFVNKATRSKSEPALLPGVVNVMTSGVMEGLLVCPY